MAAYTGADGRLWNDVNVNKTLAKDADCGVVQNVVADGKTITLPAAAAGLVFEIRNGGAPDAGTPAGAGYNGSAGITVAPNGTDTIGGGGRTSANSNTVNTKATAQVGDYLRLYGQSGGWVVGGRRGIWT